MAEGALFLGRAKEEMMVNFAVCICNEKVVEGGMKVFQLPLESFCVHNVLSMDFFEDPAMRASNAALDAHQSDPRVQKGARRCRYHDEAAMELYLEHCERKLGDKKRKRFDRVNEDLAKIHKDIKKARKTIHETFEELRNLNKKKEKLGKEYWKIVEGTKD